MAATWVGGACVGVGAPQKPRALMTSAGVCSFASVFSAIAAGFSAAAACLAFGAGTIWASAEASWKVVAICGFERGIGTGSADFAGAVAAMTLMTGTGLPTTAATLSS